MSRWLTLAIFAIGCGSSAPAQTPHSPSGSAAAAPADAAVPARPALADDLPRLALRARQLYIDWNAALSGSTDCASATTSMNALADKNADLSAATQQVLRDGHEKRKAFRAEIEKYEAELAPVAKSIAEAPIMSRCSGDPSFIKAVDRLQGDG